MISIIKEDRPNYTLLLKVTHFSHDQRCEIAVRDALKEQNK